MELIALYVYLKNSNPLRSHSRAIMALDHSSLRLGLENIFLENKSGRIFCVRQAYFTKSCQQIWGCAKPIFYTFYTSPLRWNSTTVFIIRTSDRMQTNCTQSIFRTINRYFSSRISQSYSRSWKLLRAPKNGCSYCLFIIIQNKSI